MKYWNNDDITSSTNYFTEQLTEYLKHEEEAINDRNKIEKYQ